MTLAEIVKTSGLSRRTLAERCGCSAGTIQNILKGKLPSNWAEIGGSFAGALSAVATFKQVSRAIGAFQVEALKNTKNGETKKEKDDPMFLRKQKLSPDAKKLFNVIRNPFDKPQEQENIYLCPEYRYVFETLMDAAKHGNFLAIIGESGAGKSILVDNMQEQLAAEGAGVIVVKPYVLGLSDSDKGGKPLKARDIAIAIIRTLQPNRKIPVSNEMLFSTVHKVLLEAGGGVRVLLLIEEAHDLNAHTLKTLKRFWELSSGLRRLLSIVILGQTELKEKLSSTAQDVREVVQRCDVVEMPNAPDITGYLGFVFKRAGLDLASVFSADAVAEMHALLMVSRDTSGGGRNMAYPLAINNLATGAMNQAAKFGETKVTADVVRELQKSI